MTTSGASGSDDRRALLQSALEAIDELQGELDRVRAATRQPIAVVGMSCRFPGGANTPEAYWELLRAGRDVVGNYAEHRRALIEASGVEVDPTDAERWYGGFLDDVEHFDPQFFGVSPREAASMDPQQRLVLETSWEALERAAIAPDSLNGTSTGVFVGATGTDYAQLGKLGGPDSLDVYSATGGALNAIPGRVAYTLGLQGPSMAIDTACSSSLVALHEACVSLRSRESDLALAGGVNVLLLPEAFVCFDRWGMMAADGRCKTFDAGADGFVRGEGCGMVVLKRLDDAMADGDPVLAVIRGSAVNQDGRSSGLTVPNGPAQQAVLRKAYAAAGVAPSDVQYFEAHGTGTTLGDPIEIEAMGAVLSRGRRREQGLLVGSVKTNIGHLESAAGIAGVIKVVLSMQHAEIPPHLNFHEPSPQIPWPDFDVKVPTEVVAWPGVDGRRVAGVSGFGFSGTNAHVVLESAPPVPVVELAARRCAVVLSARTESGLVDVAARTAAWLDEHPDLDVHDAGATLNTGRAHLAHRLAVVAGSSSELAERLAAHVAAPGGRGVVVGRARRPRVAFVFTGQGSQYPGMTQGLYQTEPAFRSALDRCAAALDPLLDAPLLDVLFAEPGSPRAELVGQTGTTQPALFAIELALAELWRSWGVVPEAVMGHSVGEITAATVAGVLTLADAARLVAARGSLMQALPAGGTMAVIFAPFEDVAAAVAGLDEVAVAAVNGPAHTVISGTARDVAGVAAQFAERGVRVQELVVSHAFHSPLMTPMLADFRNVVESIDLESPTIRLVSNVTGRIAGHEVTTADYWVDHVMAPVRFADGVRTLHDSGLDTFVEVGPHAVLCAMGRECVRSADTTWVPSLRRDRVDEDEMLAAAAQLHCVGVPIDWSAVRPEGRRTILPTASFDRQRYWVEPPRRSGRPAGSRVHPLLGGHSSVPAISRDIFERTLHPDDLDDGDVAWLADHRLYDEPVMPGTAYAEIALAAIRHLRPGRTPMVDSLTIREPLVVGEQEIVLQTVVGPSDDSGRAGAWEVQICSFPTDGDDHGHVAGWTTHAVATVSLGTGAEVEAEVEDEVEVEDDPDDGSDVDIDAYYDQLTGVGIGYGSTFRGLTRLRQGDGWASGTIEIEPATAAGYGLHPAQLDACFHVVGAAISGAGAAGAMYVPVAMQGLTLPRGAAPAVIRCRAELLGPAGEVAAARIRLVDADGATVATIDRLDLRRASRSAFEHARRAAAERLLYDVEWCVDDAVVPADLPPRWLVVGAGTDLAERTRAELEARGADVTMLETDPDASAFARRFDDTLSEASPTSIVCTIAAEAPSDTDDVDVWRTRISEVLGTSVDVAARAARSGARVDRVVYVSRGAQSAGSTVGHPLGAGLAGLVRTIAAETPTLDCRLIDLDPDAPDDGLARTLVDELAAESRETVVAPRGDARMVARLRRHRPTRTVSDGPLALTLGERGSLDRLSFRPMDDAVVPGSGEVAIEVHATGINFRDVLNVLGMYPGDPGDPGLECAGVVTAVGPDVTRWEPGDLVMGIAPRAYDDRVMTREDLVVAKPAAMSFAEAASVPIAFLTAHFGLDRLAALGPGERVLVHAAAGGVGLAAVHLAISVGAEVYATASSPRKHALLRSLGVEHVYSSRDGRFAERLLDETGGAGVHVVLNSLSDDLVDRSFECLAEGGRFLEIGKRGIWTPEEAAARRPDATYLPYDLADVVEDRGVLQEALDDLASRIDRGELPLLPVRSFPVARISEAFRFVAQARHVGKVVVTHDTLRARERFDGGAYVVTGGLGGLGLETAEWLTERGAGALVLVGRHAPTSDVSARLDGFRERGTRVDVVTADVSDAADVRAVFDRVDQTGLPLRGVVHAAGVIDDAVLSEQGRTRLDTVAAPKLVGGWLLDRESRGRPLDFFVSFSSASALLGSPGQANYATANAALDGLMSSRAGRGLPGVSIEWGSWSDVGMASELAPALRERLEGRGIGQISPALGRQVLASVASAAEPVVAAIDVDWSRLAGAMGSVGLAPTLGSMVDQSAGPEAGGRTATSLLTDLEGAAEGDRPAVVREFVRSHLVQVLGLDPGLSVDSGLGFTDLGLDSLMAVELANRLGAGTGLALPTTVAFEYPTLGELSDHVAEQLGIGAEDRADVATAALAEELDSLGIDDVQALLLQELEDTGY